MVYNEISAESHGITGVRTLACRSDRIREGVATITSGFSDMIILEFEL